MCKGREKEKGREREKGEGERRGRKEREKGEGERRGEGGLGKKEHRSSCISEAGHPSLEKLYNCQLQLRYFIVLL